MTGRIGRRRQETNKQQTGGMRQEGLGRKVHLICRNRQEDAGGSRRQETNKQQEGGKRQERLGRKVHLTGRNRQEEAG